MMLSLLDLPEEILIFLIKQLDIKSVYSLYKTCVTMNSIILMSGVIRVCNLSLSTMATAKSLQLDMIKYLACHLYELNLCGVSDLRKSLLLPAIKRMKCLKTLDVSYTNITILDLLELYKTCPTITNISINFQFSANVSSKIPDTVLHECQEMFTNFINVHFVLKTWLSNLPLHILKRSSLSTIKYTICDWRGKVLQGEEIDSMFRFNHFCIFVLDWGSTNVCQGTWHQLLPLVKLDTIEYIIMEYNSTYTICTSKIFVRFFEENFKITPSCRLEADRKMYGNVAILIWNKETTKFNELFYNNLKKRIKEILCCELEIASGQTFPLDVDTHCYEWFCITPIESVGSTTGYVKTESNLKKRRIVPAGQILDYDYIFKEHREIKLNVNISLPGIITLSASNNYLKKITYLSLAGTLVRYSSEFFNILFRCCENIITLNVEASSLSPCCSPIMRSIPLSRSLKNIRIVDKRIDFKMLFSSFSQCKTLENICIIDSSTDFNDLANPNTLYEMCTNLYNLCIYATIKSSVERKLQSLLNSLIKKHDTEHYINISILNKYDGFNVSEINLVLYEPYLLVFNLKPIKAV